MDMRNKHPDELTTAEFLDRNLYQVALKGGYRQEWERTKERLPSLGKYRSASEFMKELWKHRNLREKAIRELELLWKADYVLRPASGTILMLAMRRNAIGAGEDFWWRYFVGLAKGGEEICEE
jgi:hypothetical protein